MIFNVVADAVVQEVLEEICSLQEAQHVMGWSAGQRNLVFYAYGGRIAGRDHEWVQDALTMMVAMFQRMGLETNLEKPRQWCVPPGSSRGSVGSWPISGGQRGRGKPLGSGRIRGWAAPRAV